MTYNSRGFIGRIRGLSARRRRTAAAGIVATLVLPVIAVWIILYLMSLVAGAGRYFPIIAFIVFWLIAAIAVVAAAVRVAAASGGEMRVAADLGQSSGRGSLFVSALEFARGGERLAGYSQYLVSETVRRAGDELDGVDPRPLFVTAGRPGVTALAFALGVVVLLLVVFDPSGSLSVSEFVSDPIVFVPRRPGQRADGAGAGYRRRVG